MDKPSDLLWYRQDLDEQPCPGLANGVAYDDSALSQNMESPTFLVLKRASERDRRIEEKTWAFSRAERISYQCK